MDKQTIKQLVSKELPTDAQLKRVDIFVLHNKTYTDTIQCINSIVEHTDWPYRITVLDTSAYPKGLMSKMYNRLIKESPCDYISFFCSDAKATNGWLSPIMRAMEEYHPACITPATLPPCNPVIQDIINLRDGKLHEVPADRLSIAVSVFDKNAILKVGMFDENYYLYGHDPDLLDRLVKNGYKIFLCTASVVEHKGGETTKKLFTSSDILAINEYNKEYNHFK